MPGRQKSNRVGKLPVALVPAAPDTEVTSITDRDLQGRQSFSEKAR